MLILTIIKVVTFEIYQLYNYPKIGSLLAVKVKHITDLNELKLVAQNLAPTIRY